MIRIKKIFLLLFLISIQLNSMSDDANSNIAKENEDYKSYKELHELIDFAKISCAAAIELLNKIQLRFLNTGFYFDQQGWKLGFKSLIHVPRYDDIEFINALSNKFASFIKNDIKFLNNNYIKFILFHFLRLGLDKHYMQEVIKTRQQTYINEVKKRNKLCCCPKFYFWLSHDQYYELLKMMENQLEYLHAD